jgi:hypothetical protein
MLSLSEACGLAPLNLSLRNFTKLNEASLFTPCNSEYLLQI